MPSAAISIFRAIFPTITISKSIRKDNRHIFAVRGTACYATSDAPFYELCSIGIKDKFRGYPGMQYIDQFSVTAQAEFRWEVVPRWIVAFFGGVAQVAPDAGSLNSSNLLPAAGVGARFMMAEKSRIGMRLDLAYGEEWRSRIPERWGGILKRQVIHYPVSAGHRIARPRGDDRGPQLRIPAPTKGSEPPSDPSWRDPQNSGIVLS